MATYKLELKTGNAAFEGQEGNEIGRILREAARKIEDRNYIENRLSHWLYDYNGNRVGRVVIKGRASR